MAMSLRSKYTSTMHSVNEERKDRKDSPSEERAENRKKKKKKKAVSYQARTILGKSGGY